MRQLGAYLMIFGIGSMILSLIELNLQILMWIDTWGDAIGWLIRFGLAGAGVLLFFGNILKEDEILDHIQDSSRENERKSKV